jgi:hypothetical protein
MITFFWSILFFLVFLIIFYGLLKDLNTLIMNKYSLYFCELSLHEVYDSGEEYETMLMGELLVKSKNSQKEKESIQKGFEMSDYSTLKQLKERFENQLIELKQKKNGNSSKQIKYVEDWILKIDIEIKKLS